MNRVMSALFFRPRPQRKRNSYFIRMYCPDCGQFKQVTNTGLPCRDCGSQAITLASNWKPTLNVIPGGDKK